MKNLKIGKAFKKLGNFGRMFALAGTIGATSICFTGCGAVDTFTSWVQGDKSDDDKDSAVLEEKGKKLQLLRLSSGKSCALKVGYFSLDKETGDLHFVEAYEEKDDTNLSYLLTISDNMDIKYCDFAYLCNTDILLSYKIHKSESDDILSKLDANTPTSITSSSDYSSKEEVALKNVRESSYDEIIENTSLTKASEKKKK